MDLDELQTVQSRERQTDSLQQLRDSFYSEASEYVQELRDARDRAAERADDPWDDPEVSRLTDEIETAEGTVEAIYERRIGKIVKKASLAAANMPADEDGLTTEEQTMFEQLVADIEANREHVLEKIAGDVPADAEPGSDQSESAATSAETSPDPRPAPPDEPDDGTIPPTPAEETPDSSATNSVSAADVMDADDGIPSADGGIPQEAPPDSDRSDASATVERRTVKITKDVGEILGVDQREYDLSTDDVVTLPRDNAEPLFDRDAAQPLD